MKMVDAEAETIKSSKERRKSSLDLFFNIANLLIALFIGYLGLQLNSKANLTNDRMLVLAEKADSTSLDIAHFNQLLDTTAIIVAQQSKLAGLSAAQIDSMVVLIRQTATVADVVKEQYNMGAREVNAKTLDLLNKRIDDYNSLYGVMNNLNYVLAFYKVSKEGNPVGDEILHLEDIKKRVAFLDITHSSFIRFTHIQDLFPTIPIMPQWEDCMGDVATYKTIYTLSLELGQTTDTSIGGINEYRNVLGKVYGLVDTIYKHIEASKAVTQRQAKIVRAELDRNISPRNRFLN